MQIRTINYSQSKETMYGYGLKRWDKCGVDIELSDGDNPENAFAMARQLVNEQLDKVIDETNEMRGTIVRNIPSERPTNTQEALIYDINSCTELKVLETYKFLSSKYPEIKEAYENKLNQLCKK